MLETFTLNIPERGKAKIEFPRAILLKNIEILAPVLKPCSIEIELKINGRRLIHGLYPRARAASTSLKTSYLVDEIWVKNNQSSKICLRLVFVY